ncbi:GNT-I family-domain-containing protein [Blyttiomyces helicus]|uniref:GNT-I family-domain-containing protein n=1 Tax=Blyttiomyces helicus TaxID=388810 RepID=A0A4P9WH01_9FUNG|nr:GNT-I family-domain-containing protein [Blyttiomyces helicus]|eukprot:RKO92089.1 GNT-I family-domain-containing protein [Blyttiomyces helicus]
MALAESFGIRVAFDGRERPEKLQVRVSMRYQFVFDRVFGEGEEFVVVIEDDLTAAVDFVDYFHGLAGAMRRDESIFCVSAWNDNAYPATSANSSVVRRGEHFMALGWMTSKRIYENNVKPHWENVGGRDWDWPFAQGMKSDHKFECLFPEVSRVHHERDQEGQAYSTSHGLQKDRFETMSLATIPKVPLNPDAVESTAYETSIHDFIADAIPITAFEDIFTYHHRNLVFRCEDCSSERRPVDGWKKLLEKRLGVYSFGIDGRVRGEHRGSVFIRHATNLVLIVGRDSEYYPGLPMPTTPVVPPGSDAKSWIAKSTRTIVGAAGQSCVEVCDATPGFVCDAQAMGFLNGCAVLAARVPECAAECKVVESKFAPLRDLEDGCAITWPRFINCESKEEGTSRICVCVKE